MSTRRIRNWDGTQSWKPEAIYYPEDEEQIAKLIQLASEKQKRIKAVGEALSWSDIIDVPETAIRFDKMSKVLQVDRDNRQIRVQAGARLNYVNEVLAREGLAFDNFGSIVLQTAAGYIATGTHGTGAKTPILSTSIDKIRVIDGRGELVQLDDEHEPELFSAARVNLGCLGIVTEITFRCIEAFDLEERLELLDFDTVLADLNSYVNDNDYCKLWWLPYTNKIQVYTFNKTTRPRCGFGFTGFMDRTGLSGLLFTGLIRLGRAFPKFIPFLHDTVQRIHFHPRRRVDRSDQVIKVSNSIPIHQETEYAIPADQAAKAIDETRKLVLKANYRVNFPMEVRFVAADDLPMSPSYGRDSCYIGAYVSSPKWASHYFAEFQSLMGDYDGRPHWGKSFSRTHKELRALYPAYDEFDRLRRRCDPNGLFRNSFLDRVFPAR
ncbi:MAG: D-arabinono-1,4-lactone oxidase [Planctomycetota bacterium]|jgi:L-gulonolactone oxidase